MESAHGPPNTGVSSVGGAARQSLTQGSRAGSGVLCPESPSHRIREVDPDNPDDARTAAQLHLELFREIGPMAQLGELIMRKYTYARLIRDGLIRAAIYYVEGQPAGMVAYTERSVSFHRSAVRRHWAYIGWLLALTLVRQPRVLISLPSVALMMLSRRGEQGVLGEDPMAEVLAIGVLQEFRSPEFVQGTGLRVGDHLQDYVVDYFKRAGFKRVRIVVDADNAPALLYWHRVGGQFEPYDHGKKASVQIWLDLPDNSGLSA